MADDTTQATELRRELTGFIAEFDLGPVTGVTIGCSLLQICLDSSHRYKAHVLRRWLGYLSDADLTVHISCSRPDDLRLNLRGLLGVQPLVVYVFYSRRTEARLVRFIEAGIEALSPETLLDGLVAGEPPAVVRS